MATLQTPTITKPTPDHHEEAIALLHQTNMRLEAAIKNRRFSVTWDDGLYTLWSDSTPYPHPYTGKGLMRLLQLILIHTQSCTE